MNGHQTPSPSGSEGHPNVISTVADFNRNFNRDSGAQQARPGRRLTVAHAPHDAHSETLRALRTELLLRRHDAETAQVMALLSPCHCEGRSQLAAELAIVFSQLGRTLLVDADLRYPEQHMLFNCEN